MAVLRLDELEAFIEYVYKLDPTTQYSTTKLKSQLKSFNIENSAEDINLLHEKLYLNDLHFDQTKILFGYSEDQDDDLNEEQHFSTCGFL